MANCEVDIRTLNVEPLQADDPMAIVTNHSNICIPKQKHPSFTQCYAILFYCNLILPCAIRLEGNYHYLCDSELW